CSDILKALTARGIGLVYSEAGYRLRGEAPTWIQPDVSFRKVGSARPGPAEYFLGSPDLAVEIVSPSESASDLQRKIELLLKNGALAVWVIYPATFTVQVHLADGTGFTRTIGEMLDAP